MKWSITTTPINNNITSIITMLQKSIGPFQETDIRCKECISNVCIDIYVRIHILCRNIYIYTFIFISHVMFIMCMLSSIIYIARCFMTILRLHIQHHPHHPQSPTSTGSQPREVTWHKVSTSRQVLDLEDPKMLCGRTNLAMKNITTSCGIVSLLSNWSNWLANILSINSEFHLPVTVTTYRTSIFWGVEMVLFTTYFGPM